MTRQPACLSNSNEVSSPGAEQEWVEEITRRAERARAGQTAGIDTDAVHAEARRILEGR
jgi:hypothetical protein